MLGLEFTNENDDNLKMNASIINLVSIYEYVGKIYSGIIGGNER